MKKDIKIEYNGAYPNPCSGTLVVTLDNKRWEFPKHCLSSGGNVWFDGGWDEHVESGAWVINKWPEGFPEEHKSAVEYAVNAEIPEGCCGGCI